MTVHQAQFALRDWPGSAVDSTRLPWFAVGLDRKGARAMPSAPCD